MTFDDISGIAAVLILLAATTALNR